MGGDPAAALHLFWAVARDLTGLGQRCPDVSLSCPEQHCPACPGVTCPDNNACYQLVGEFAAAARSGRASPACPAAQVCEACESCLDACPAFPWLLILLLCCLAKQVLIDFFDDENGLNWHARILLIPGGQGRWIVCSPTLAVQVADLSSHRIRILRRGEPIDPAYLREAFVFDEELDEGELARIRAEAHELAEVAGFDLTGFRPAAGPAAAAENATWRVADPVHRAFGEVVPLDALRDQEGCTLGDKVGWVTIDDTGVLIEQVVDDRLEAWLSAKRCGPGRDPRLLGDVRDHRGLRYLHPDDATKRQSKTKMPYEPFEGPEAAEEFMVNMLRVGFNFVTHNLDWEAKSGVSPKSGLAREHRHLSSALFVAQSVDL
ncbi:unnamed protein product, partial [Prorocentrum cordatum]